MEKNRFNSIVINEGHHRDDLLVHLSSIFEDKTLKQVFELFSGFSETAIVLLLTQMKNVKQLISIDLGKINNIDRISIHWSVMKKVNSKH